MTFCIKEADVQRQVSLILLVMAGKHVKSMAVIINIEVTVPTPGSIRIREMAGTGAVMLPVF